MVRRNPITLRLVRDGESYRKAMFSVEAAAGKVEYSAKLAGLIKSFIDIVGKQVFPAAKRSGGETKFPHANPETEIRKELTLFRQSHYGTVNELAELLADNLILWGTPLSSITPKGTSGKNALLMAYAVNAIDRVLLKSVREWWNQQEGAGELAESLYKQVTAGVRGDAYPLEPLRFVVMRVAAYKDVEPSLAKLGKNLTYGAPVLLALTAHQLESLSKFDQQQPGVGLAELNKQYPPILNLPITLFQKAVKDEPDLLLANVFKLVEGLGDGSNLAHLIKAVVESATSHNVSELAKDSKFSEAFSSVSKEEHRAPPEQQTIPGKKVRQDSKESKETVVERPRRPKASYIGFVPFRELAR